MLLREKPLLFRICQISLSASTLPIHRHQYHLDPLPTRRPISHIPTATPSTALSLLACRLFLKHRRICQQLPMLSWHWLRHSSESLILKSWLALPIQLGKRPAVFVEVALCRLEQQLSCWRFAHELITGEVVAVQVFFLQTRTKGSVVFEAGEK